jgi:predicted  nucleic acid-binding Zn-ribbon protein
MRPKHAGSPKAKVSIPEDLQEKIGTEEEIIRLMKIGLLSLRIASLEREIADLIERTEKSKKLIAELPPEIKRFQRLLGEAVQDEKILEKLLGRRIGI